MATRRQDIEVLRNNQLMGRSQFSEMVYALDKHFASPDDTRRLPFGRTRSARTFYSLLLKMLYEVALTRTTKKQLDDVHRVYLWYQANKSYWNTTAFKSADVPKLRLSDNRGRIPYLEFRSVSAPPVVTTTNVVGGTDVAMPVAQVSRRPRIIRGRPQSPAELAATLTIQSAFGRSRHEPNTTQGTLLTWEAWDAVNNMQRDKETVRASAKSDTENGFTFHYLKYLGTQSPSHERKLNSVEEDKVLTVHDEDSSQVDPDEMAKQAYAIAAECRQKLHFTDPAPSPSASPPPPLKEHSPTPRARARPQMVRLQNFPDELTVADLELTRSQKQHKTRQSVKAHIVYSLASQLDEQLMQERMKLNEGECLDIRSTKLSQLTQKDSPTGKIQHEASKDETVLSCSETSQTEESDQLEDVFSLVSEADTSLFGESVTNIDDSYPSVVPSVERIDSATRSGIFRSPAEYSSPVSMSGRLVASEAIPETDIGQQLAPPSTPKSGSDFGDVSSSETSKMSEGKPASGCRAVQLRKSKSPWPPVKETGNYRWSSDGVGGRTYMKSIVKRHMIPAQQLSPRLHTTPMKTKGVKVSPRPVEMTKSRSEMLHSTMKVKSLKPSVRENRKQVGSSSSTTLLSADTETLKRTGKSSPQSNRKTPLIVVDGEDDSSAIVRRIRPSSSASSSRYRPSSSNSQLDNTSVSSFRLFSSSVSLRAELERYQWVGLDRDFLDSDGIMRLREARAAVDIQRIFRGYKARQYYRDRKGKERERKERAATLLQRNFRSFLTRKKEMEKNIGDRDNLLDKAWVAQYRKEMAQKQTGRQKGFEKIMHRQARDYHKRIKSLNAVQAHCDIYKIFHPTAVPREVKSKAALAIQRAWKGYRERKAQKAFTAASLLSGASPWYVVRDFYSRVERLRRMHNYCEQFMVPNANFVVLQDYATRRDAYGKAFKKLMTNGKLGYNMLKDFFKECGYFPTTEDLHRAVLAVTGAGSAEEVKDLTVEQSLDAIFYLYLPCGSNIEPSHKRQSTWLNPMVEGREALTMKEKIAKDTDLQRCLMLVAEARTQANQ